MTATSLRLAVLAGMETTAGDAVARLEGYLAEAADAHVDLLVAPQRLLGESPLLSDAPSLRAIAASAGRHGVAVVCGYLEHCTGRTHEAVQAMDGNGRALANYRQTHLGPGAIERGVSPGQWLTQVRIGTVGVGLLLGEDVLAPEPARALALAGTAILALPANLGSESAALMPSLLRARAFENGCAIAFANRADHPASMIIGPDGDVLAEALRGLAVAEVPTSRPAEAARRLAARRPLLYQRLASSHPPDEALRL